MYDMVLRHGILRRKQVKCYWQWTWVLEVIGIDIKAVRISDHITGGKIGLKDLIRMLHKHLLIFV